MRQTQSQTVTHSILSYYLRWWKMLIQSLGNKENESSYLAILKPWKVRREIKLYSLTSSWQGDASDQDDGH